MQRSARTSSTISKASAAKALGRREFKDRRSSSTKSYTTDDSDTDCFPLLEKFPLPISHEFDTFAKQHSGDPNINRSDWLQRVLDRNPEIRGLRECVNPVVRAASFARLYLPNTRLIPHNLLLALISQHFRTLGLSQSQEALHSEWGSDFNIPPHKLYSQLTLLLQRGVLRAEKFWEIAMPSIHAPENVELTQKALDEEISRTIGAAPSLLEDKAPLSNEEPGDPNFIIIENDDVAEASLNQIIYYLTPLNKDPSLATKIADLTNAICLTISTYTSSKVFFSKLKERFNQLFKNESSKETQFLCVKLFKDWLRGSMNDIEPQTLEQIKQFVDTELIPRFPIHCNKLFEEKMNRLTMRHEVLLKYEKAPKVELGNCNGLWIGQLNLFSLPEIELARQLTIWSSNRYYSIKRCELLDCAWTTPRLRYRAPNVIALTSHFNRVSQWVQVSILYENNLKIRISKMEYLLRVAKQLFEMRNYYDCNAIIGGFDSNSMFRLERHFKMMNNEAQDILNDYKSKFQNENNYAILRKLDDAALNSSKPVLPYIAIYLGDLFKYYDATKTFVNNLINVRKCKSVYKMIAKIEEFSRDKYYFLPIDQVQTEIESWKDYDDDVLIGLSNEIEGPAGTELKNVDTKA